MGTNGDLDKDLFLAQYNQMWEWKRFHTRLAWQVPVILGTIAGAAVSIGWQGSPNPVKWLLVLITVMYISGIILLFFRHNSFQKGINLVINQLEKSKVPIESIPKKGNDLVQFLSDKPGYHDFVKSRYAFWGWLLIFLSFLIYLFIRLTSL